MAIKILMTGNPEKDLAKAVFAVCTQKGYVCTGLSRRNGYDFDQDPLGCISRILKIADDYDVFINLYANSFFNASVLAHKLFNQWYDKGYSHKRIINIGSTTDRVQRGKRNLYHYEKRILREMSSGHAMIGVWEKGPKVTHLSLGTLSNRAAQNPGRKCLDLAAAAGYIAWVLEQPPEIHVNELSIDPIQ